MKNQQLSLNRRLPKSRISRKPRLKTKRWYVGFKIDKYRKTPSGTWITPDHVLEMIGQVVQDFDLSQWIPLIKIEKKDGKKGGFYFFLAIDSTRSGQIPDKLRPHIESLYCFREPADKFHNNFTYESIKPMIGITHTVKDFTDHIPYIESQLRKQVDPFWDFDDPEESDHASNPNLLNLLDWLSAKGHGSWATFQVVCQSLAIEHPALST